MRNHWKTVAVALVVAVAALAATALYADTTHDRHGLMMGRGMMGMMEQMSGMMRHCTQMMGTAGAAKPNEQWQKEPPKEPEKKI